MTMGWWKPDEQGDFRVATSALPAAARHPFYERVNQILAARRFDEFVESECRNFYHERLGRPSLPPAVYFRCQQIGYLEGLDSERGIAWRAEDSLGLRRFLGWANQRRIRGVRGRRMMRRRGELIERSFAHCYDTGGKRRTHLRGPDNILKRVLVHVAGFNLSLVMRKLQNAGTPRGWSGLPARIWDKLRVQLLRRESIAALRRLYAPPTPRMMPGLPAAA